MQILLVIGYAKGLSQEVVSYQQGRAEDDEVDPKDEGASRCSARPCASSTHDVSCIPRPWPVAPGLHYSPRVMISSQHVAWGLIRS